MKKIFLFILLIIFETGFAQKVKKNERVKDKFESKQPQDLSVPPPPMITFPAQYPNGNKAFIDAVKKNIDKSALKELNKELKTKIILKIDSEGNVINISTYGDNEIFNNEVKKAADKTTSKVKWEAGKNNQGEKVIDIVNLPFKFSNI
ncbi:hypothetical protein NAL32_10295 [Chryseobacterium sp. Ch-15]|uniref:TonB C-terminal domain-containing protein n=1 Tax=Chryseobacterium muglaense TaxID=2893752 RepID=A0A9Q3YQD4_9FLAO|nr:hypothetical protein [Chryseobacterium muglaense]MBD3906143.1 hypothetical protein [Chryseobacterium muglaense]MCC9033699.1 hypothetical protein [Chryseobacterium muglaense]MCM2554774.1 hypothetical protein [Chryseobacterium muglaense]